MKINKNIVKIVAALATMSGTLYSSGSYSGLLNPEHTQNQQTDQHLSCPKFCLVVLGLIAGGLLQAHWEHVPGMMDSLTPGDSGHRLRGHSHKPPIPYESANTSSNYNTTVWGFTKAIHEPINEEMQRRLLSQHIVPPHISIVQLNISQNQLTELTQFLSKVRASSYAEQVAYGRPANIDFLKGQCFMPLITALQSNLQNHSIPEGSSQVKTVQDILDYLRIHRANMTHPSPDAMLDVSKIIGDSCVGFPLPVDWTENWGYHGGLVMLYIIEVGAPVLVVGSISLCALIQMHKAGYIHWFDSCLPGIEVVMNQLSASHTAQLRLQLRLLPTPNQPQE